MGDLCASLSLFKKKRLKLDPVGLIYRRLIFIFLLFICKIFNSFLSVVYYNEYFRTINFPLSSDLVVFCRFYFVAFLSFSRNLKL